MSDLEKRCRAQVIKHLALASKYEESGNADIARECRAVANLLGALVQGENGKTIHRDCFPPPGAFYCYPCDAHHDLPPSGSFFCALCHDVHPIHDKKGAYGLYACPTKAGQPKQT